MSPLKISLVILGNLKYPLSIAELEAWHSQIISIEHGASVGHLPDADGDDWEYPDHQLLKVLGADTNADFTLGVINAPLEENYYMRRLSDKVAVLSIHQMADIIRYSDFTIEQFVLRNTYELAVLFAANGKLIPSDYTTWAHDETRGCIFDMNASKSDIVFSLNKPVLCPACRIKVSEKQVPADLLVNLDKELKRIQKTLYVRIVEWIKCHPIFALGITALTGVALNLIASILFEKAKVAFPWFGQWLVL